MALDNLEGKFLPRHDVCSIVANGKTAFAEQFSNLVGYAIGVVCAGGLDYFRWRRGRVFLVLGCPELSYRLGLDLSRLGRSLGVGVPRRQGLQIDAASGH